MVESDVIEFSARAQPSAPDSLLESLKRVVSRHTGIASRFRIHRVAPSEPSFWYCTADLPGSGMAGGVGLDPDVTALTCLAEAVERYCARVIDQARLVYATAEELRRSGRRTLGFAADVVDPTGKRLDLASTIEGVGGSRPLHWLAGESLSDGGHVWAPASRVYLDFPVRQERSGEVTSTGLAAGSTLEEATERGLCELVERDAVMVTWLTQRTVGNVDLTAPDLDHAHQAAERHRAAGAEIKAFDITTDIGVPAFLALARRTAGGPSLAAGAACHLDAHRALTKAILEAAHIHYLARTLQRRFPAYAPPAEFTHLRTFDDRALLYSHPAMLHAADFLWNSPLVTRLQPSAVPRSLGTFHATLHRFPSETVRFDLTTPEIGDLGLRVVRVVAPSLQPLEANFGRRIFFPRRLIPWLPASRREECWRYLNPNPHPIA